MPLRVLDGNQTATTLSSVVTGGEHIVAHTVVSLGSTAISNITSAVSGITISGTVTANLPLSGAYGGLLQGYNGTNTYLNVGIQNIGGASLNGASNLPISGSVTIGGISNVDVIPSVVTGVYLGPISNSMSAVTVNTSAFDSGTSGDHVNFKFVYWATGSIPSGTNTLQASSDNSTWVNVTTGFDITTQSEQTIVLDNIGLYAVKNYLFPRTAARRYWRVRTGPQPSGGQDSYARFSVFNTRPDYQFIDAGFLLTGETLGYYALSTAIANPVTVGNSVTIGSLPTLTPQLPRVTFIDGSGTVVTANSAVTLFASSSTRSYLLVQVTTGSAFVNVGATATTVNGISLTAGQGYAWETTIPQGVVSLISTTTSSRYVAKQA